MLFLPKGLMAGEAGDADDLTAEFQEAMRIASKTSQYQFAQDGIESQGFFQNGLAEIRTTGVQALLGQSSASAKPKLTSGSIDSNLFSIPYNRGYTDIPDSEVTWTSEYPELVWAIFSFQYLRAKLDDGTGEASDMFTEADFQPRAKVRLSVDDVLQPGAGVYQIPFDTTYRGDGYAGRALASTAIAVVHLPPGTHSVKGVAAQAVAFEVTENYIDEGSAYVDTNAQSGVYIGSRRTTVLSIAMGGRLGS